MRLGGMGGLRLGEVEVALRRRRRGWGGKGGGL